MRKNTARHLLHAVLDLLPVILIPVFMIYSHRHVLTERTEVDIQYKYQSNEVNSLDDLIDYNIYLFNGPFYIVDDTLPFGVETDLYFVSFTGLDFSYGSLDFDDYYFADYQNKDFNYIHFVSDEESNFTLYISNEHGYTAFYNNISDVGFFLTDCILYTTNVSSLKTLINGNIANYDLVIGDIQYTDYNVIESVDVQDTNSDIMSVFMDDFNYTVNKYFNMGNVFNLKDVYHWFEVNIFNNNPPVVFASIYNIIVYEFVMDLLFLLYGLFMWFVDMLKRLIEKPIDSIK